MSADRMPPDPFDEGYGQGVLAEIAGEAGLLLDALAEARERGRLFEAVFALEVADLRAVVLDVAPRDALRRGRFGEDQR